MPLSPGSDRATISRNISELTHHGSRPRSHDQIVAIALSNADKHPRRADGGIAGGPPRLATGGFQTPYPPFFVRQEAREMDAPYHPGGLIESDAAGRTDRLPYNVAADSFVLPADVVSGLGQGNTLAGARIMDQILGSGAPYGASLPSRHRRAAGGNAPGGTGPAGVILAGGEYLIHRAHLERFGHRMRAAGKSRARSDLAAGHEWARAFVKRVRGMTKQFLKHAPEPKR